MNPPGAVAVLAGLTPSSVTLPDGRTLSWYELGDLAGVPCVYVGGTPTSGLVGALYDDAARAAGVRLLSVDKPGYGGSSVDPQRSLLRFSRDVEAVLDHLGLDRVAVVGESGGGPHALTLAHDLPDRVSLAVPVAGLGPGAEPWVRAGMWRVNRTLLWLGAHAPRVVELAMGLMSRTLLRPGRQAAFDKATRGPMPACDRQVLDRNPELGAVMHAAAIDAVRSGPRGAADEFRVFRLPWHFAVEDIRVPVALWHGVHDVNVPVRTATEIHRRVPGSLLHLKQESGHLLYEHRAEVFDAVARAGSVSP